MDGNSSAFIALVVIIILIVIIVIALAWNPAPAEIKSCNIRPPCNNPCKENSPWPPCKENSPYPPCKENTPPPSCKENNGFFSVKENTQHNTKTNSQRINSATDLLKQIQSERSPSVFSKERDVHPVNNDVSPHSFNSSPKSIESPVESAWNIIARYKQEEY